MANTPLEVLEEVNRQGELYLTSTLQVGLAADQRAAVMSGIFGAGSLAIVGAAVTLATTGHLNGIVIGVCLVAAVFLLTASIICGFSCIPRDFYLPGYEPNRLAPAAIDKTTLLKGCIEDIQARIKFNAGALERSARQFKYSCLCAAGSIGVGILILFVAWLADCPLA